MINRIRKHCSTVMANDIRALSADFISSANEIEPMQRQLIASTNESRPQSAGNETCEKLLTIIYHYANRKHTNTKKLVVGKTESERLVLITLCGST